jgi:hypothetical protein
MVPLTGGTQMRKLSMAMTAAVIVAALAYLALREPTFVADHAGLEGDATARVAPHFARLQTTSSARVITNEPPSPEVIARPSCTGDLLAIDAMSGLDGVRAAFARGLPGGDEAVADYLRALVALRIGDSTENALLVLALAQDASADEARVLLAGLSESAAAHDPRVAEGLLALGARSTARDGVRIAALDALRTQRTLDGSGRTQLRDLALDDEGSEDVAWHATRALGSVMAEGHARGEAFEPYWDELAKIATTNRDASVRALALEAPMHADTILPASKLDTLVDLMFDEPHRDVRELAVFQLGLTSSPAEALDAFRRAFEVETDVCVRAAIVRFAVRAALAASLPLLDHFASIDPVFIEDVADFRALFAAGYQDFEQIWLHKPERHACIVDDGEPHGGAL